MFGTGTRRVAIGLATVICVLGLVSCGSDSKSEGAGTTTGSTGGSASTTEASGTRASGSGAEVAIASTDLGEVMVDGDGNTLYLFTPDGTGTPTCVDACADTWPPLVSEGEPSANGIDSGVLSTVKREDSSTQVTADGHPLYTYSGDSGPGDTTGQGSGGNWYVVAADGSAIKDDSSGGSGY